MSLGMYLTMLSVGLHGPRSGPLPFIISSSTLGKDLKLDKDSHLSGTTRVLVTNALNFLPKCDHVIVIDQGQIVESGTYHELKSGQSKFSNLLREFTGSEINDDNDQSEQAVEQANQSHDEDEHDDLADVYNVDDGTSIIGKGYDESSVMSQS